MTPCPSCNGVGTKPREGPTIKREAIMATLPRPDVSVTHSDGVPEGAPPEVNKGVSVTISRDGKSRTYSSVATSRRAATKEVVEKILGDRFTGEWLP